MRYIQGRHNGRAAIVQVAIIDAAKYREHKQSQKPLLTGTTSYSALIDTGATRTMISRKIVEELSLAPVSKEQFHGVSGPVQVLTYLYHVAFYDTTFKNSLHGDDGDQHMAEHQSPAVNKLLVYTKTISGGEMAGKQSFDVLLGMDVITTGCLIVDKDGTFSLNYE